MSEPSTGFGGRFRDALASGGDYETADLFDRNHILRTFLALKGYTQGSQTTHYPSRAYDDQLSDSFKLGRRSEYVSGVADGQNPGEEQGDLLTNDERDDSQHIENMDINRKAAEGLDGKGDDDLDADQAQPTCQCGHNIRRRHRQPESTGPRDGNNPLFEGTSVNEETGLFFRSAEQGLALFKNQPLWRPAEEPLPEEHFELEPYVVLIRDAVMSVSASSNRCGDSTTSPDQPDSDVASLGRGDDGILSQEVKTAVAEFDTTEVNERSSSEVPKTTSTKSQGPGGGSDRWGPTASYYEDQAIEIAARLLLERVLSLHKEGWVRPNLDKSQLNVRKLYEPALCFEDRIDAILDVLKTHKAACKALLDQDDLYIDQLVAGPNKYLARAGGNKTNNKKRRGYYATGREEAKRSNPKVQVTSQVHDTNGSKSQATSFKKRNAESSARTDEGVETGGTLGQATQSRSVKKPRLAR
ncbi:hypothetical protein BU16DRAFT_537982 [Lophium mytilinum]|uniref:Uncharacterized protein n=1 Tax=Lophium mytilinum TaxID=390894 RepID=A0A6A6R0B1_9PEZI|nr:hypothetical protein BU16DRAFT_537982 [Lophium mytilinum]